MNGQKVSDDGALYCLRRDESVYFENCRSLCRDWMTKIIVNPTGRIRCTACPKPRKVARGGIV